MPPQMAALGQNRKQLISDVSFRSARRKRSLPERPKATSPRPSQKTRTEDERSALQSDPVVLLTASCAIILRRDRGEWDPNPGRATKKGAGGPVQTLAPRRASQNGQVTIRCLPYSMVRLRVALRRDTRGAAAASAVHAIPGSSRSVRRPSRGAAAGQPLAPQSHRTDRSAQMTHSPRSIFRMVE